MTAASEPVAPDRERAETYLRFQAEAELRQALAMPQYQPPRPPLPARIASRISQSHRMRRRRASIDRIMRQRAGGGPPGNQGGVANQSGTQPVPVLPVLRRTARSLESAGTRVARPAATVLRSAGRAGYQISARLQSATWPLREQLRRRFSHRAYQSPPADACLRRLGTLAGVLAAVGAISARTEEDVVEGLRAALAARNRIEPDALLAYGRFGSHPMRRRAVTTTARRGPSRAIPVGVSAKGQVHGHPVRFWLGVLLLDRVSATLTMQARFGPELADEDDPHRMHPIIDALNETTASDDRGGSYRLRFHGGGGDELWRYRFRISPAPQPSARWLDVVLPGAPAVRVRLDEAPGQLRMITEPVTTSAAERFLDAQAIDVLSGKRPIAAWLADGDLGPSLFQLASDLLAAGLLTADSASLRRLAAVAARSGTNLPGALAVIEPGALPDCDCACGAASGDENGGAHVARRRRFGLALRDRPKD